ncbi:MAG: DHH family phosphoesterase [Deltaproteobacteria bacterium]|nr:DHH family phosphoesterase [Deltaproteobacteria bacterium]MBW2307434.1 DHH family phosphoesterase [Deltaproteobacteria bacterium]
MAKRLPPGFSSIHQERINKLWELFKGDDRLLIIINPDPDSIASALALKRLLWKRVHIITLAYVGKITRLENQAMIRLLRVKMEPLENVNLSEFTKHALIDSQPSHHEEFQKLDYHVIIDHHPITNSVKAPFKDIRPIFGAVASMMTEYLQAARIVPSSRIATALLYAIKSDTANFERDATEADVRAFRYLFHFANINIVRKIEFSEIKRQWLSFFLTALNHLHLHRNRVIVHLGSVPNPDICVLLADFFMRVTEITWSVVSGICEEKLIIIFRNDGHRKNAGQLAINAFGTLGIAGGHKGAARAEIPLENIRNQIKESVRQNVEGFILNKLKWKRQ